MAFLDPVLNPILLPLLNSVGPFWGIVIVAFFISLIITIVYKFVTNQELMKSLKDKQKEFQKKMKESRDNPTELMSIQKEAMKVNMEYMKHSFKPTLITMLPIILIFGWMSAHLAFEPIYPGETFTVAAIFNEGVTGEAELIIDNSTTIMDGSVQEINSVVEWNVKSDEGYHNLKVKVGDVQQTKKVLITTDLLYEEPITTYQHSDIKEIRIDYKELKPLGETSIFGWRPGWLGIYIILSILFSMTLRKIMKLH